jgi:hypothetical protein
VIDAVRREVGRYYATLALINLGLGLATGLAMMALGMPNPILWGALACQPAAQRSARWHGLPADTCGIVRAGSAGEALPAHHFLFAGFDSRFAAAARGRPCFDFATVPFAFFAFFAAAFTTALAGTSAGVSGAGARA